MSNKVLETIGLTKYFYEPTKFKVLENINLSVNHGEFVSIVENSVCGKSNFLYLLYTMDTNYEGKVLSNEEEVTGKSDVDLARIRNENIGFVFQFHYLLSEYNVLKNVMLPGLKLAKLSEEEVEHQAMEHLKTLGMQDQALKMPNQLSGGQKQRVAIARALINNPLIIMGDEPTGNLDKKNSYLVFDIFKELTQEHNQTLLVVTHDNEFASRTNRTVIMEDGKIIS